MSKWSDYTKSEAGQEEIRIEGRLLLGEKMTNDQLKALMTAIIYSVNNVVNDWEIENDIEKENPSIAMAVAVTERICEEYTTLIV